MTNAREMAGRIQQMADEVVTAVNGQKGQVAGLLADAIAGLSQVQYAAENPVGEIGNLLGDGHPGLDAIAGNTIPVVDAVIAVAGMIQAAIAALEDVSNATSQLAFVYTNVGASLAGGGQ